MNLTEEKILQAAEEIFLKQGYDGSRMQAIADLAGINKAMLHYYFRSKDQLFERIFKEKYGGFFPTIEGLISSQINFIDKICTFAEKYTLFLIENPYLPLFVINNINKNPDFAKNLPLNLPKTLVMSYMEDAEKGLCRLMNPAQLFMSIFGMCIFPFIGKPMIQKVTGENDEDFKELMKMRSNEIKEHIRLILKP